MLYKRNLSSEKRHGYPNHTTDSGKTGMWLCHLVLGKMLFSLYHEWFFLFLIFFPAYKMYHKIFGFISTQNWNWKNQDLRFTISFQGSHACTLKCPELNNNSWNQPKKGYWVFTVGAVNYHTRSLFLPASVLT